MYTVDTFGKPSAIGVKNGFTSEVFLAGPDTRMAGSGVMTLYSLVSPPNAELWPALLCYSIM